MAITPDKKDNLELEIGYVAAAHGLRGELYIRLHHPTSDSLDFVDSLTFQTRSGDRHEHIILDVRPLKKGFGVIVKGVMNRTAAFRRRLATGNILPTP